MLRFRPDPMSPQRPQNASPAGLGGPRMSARSALQPQSMQQPQRLQSRVQSQNAQNLEHSQLPQHPQAFPQASLHSHQPFDPRTIQHSQRLQHSMPQQTHPQQTHSQSYYPVNYFASKTDSQMQFIPSRSGSLVTLVQTACDNLFMTVQSLSFWIILNCRSKWITGMHLTWKLKLRPLPMY